MIRFGFPRRIILNGEDGKVYVWVLTPTGVTTPNSIHIWMDNKIFGDTLIWTD